MGVNGYVGDVAARRGGGDKLFWFRPFLSLSKGLSGLGYNERDEHD